MTVPSTLTDERLATALAQLPSPDEHMAAVARELWALSDSSMRIEEAEFPAAVAAGAAAFLAGDDPATLVRRIHRVGAGLGALVGAQPNGAALRLREVTEEAVAQACSAMARAGRERREAWLSFLCHDIKNPLNTVFNALWLIREHKGGGNTARFLDLAERAVRRMEADIKDIRELQQKERSLPRSRADRNPDPVTAPTKQ